MIEKHLVNNSLRNLKYFFIAFGLLPFLLLMLFVFTGNKNNEVENIFYYVASITFVISILVVLKLSTLSNYYLSISKNEIHIPVSSFLHANYQTLSFSMKNISSVKIEPSFEGGTSIIIHVNSLLDTNKENVAVVGEMLIESKNHKTIISINNLKKSIAKKWGNILIDNKT